MPYIGSTPTKVVSRQSATVYSYTATAGQTVFTGADVNNAVLACNPADMIVHMNGLRLESTDYTATSTTVTLVTASTAGDEVTITSFATFEVADTYNKATADTRYVNTTGDTMTGGLNVTGGNVGIGISSPSSILHILGTDPKITLGVSGAAERAYLQYDNTASLLTLDSDGATRFSTNNTERMRIDSAGRVTMPYQPAFLATSTSGWVDYTSGQTFAFNNETLDVGNNYNTSTYAFTAPVSGVYHIFANAYMDTSAPRVSMYVNGTQLLGGGDVVPYIDTVQTSMGTMSHNVYLNSNDYVTIGARSGYSARAYMGHSSFGGYLIG